MSLIDTHPDPKRRPLSLQVARWLIIWAARRHEFSRAYISRELYAIRHEIEREIDERFRDARGL